MDSSEFQTLKAQVARLEQELSIVRQRLLAIEAQGLTQGLAQDKSVREDPARASSPAAAASPAARPPATPTAPARASGVSAIPSIPPPPRRGAAAAARPSAPSTGIPFVPARVAPREPGPVQQFVTNAWRRYGPPADLSWEMALGTWWLPRIGIGVLCIAAVWLMTLFMGSLPAAWWPYLRLGIGAVACLGLLGIGRWLEGRHTDYARVLMSGGIAMSYLVIYATHYIEYTRIVFTPAPTLMLLAALTALWFSFAAVRRSWLLAMFVTTAGHATVALSTVTLASPHPTAIMGLLALAAGTAAFLPREGWRTVAFAGMLGSYGNYFLWLANSPGSDAVSAFVTALLVLVVFFALYLVADFFQPVPQRARFRPRSLYASVNTAGLVVLGYGLMQGFPFTVNEVHQFFFLAAAGLAAIAAAYAFLRDGDRIYDIFIAKASLLLALGFAEWLDGRTLTVALALEALVLLALSMRQGLASTRLLALLAATAAFIHGLTVTPTAWVPDMAVQSGPIVAVLAAVAAFLGMAALYAKADWQRHAGPPVPATTWWQPFAVELEWVRAKDGSIPNSRHAIAVALAVAASILLYAHASTLVPRVWVPALLAHSGLGLAVAAAAITLPAWSVAAMVTGAVAALATWFAIQDNYPLLTVACALVGLMALSLASERRYFGQFRGLAPLRVQGVGPTAYGATAFLLASTLLARTPGELHHSAWFAVGAALALSLSFVLHAKAWQFITAAYLVTGASVWAGEAFVRPAAAFLDSTEWLVIALGLISLGLAAERLFKQENPDQFSRGCGSAGLIVSTAVLLLAIVVRVEPPWHALPHAAVAFALLAWGAAFRTRTAVGLSALVAAMTTFWAVAASANGSLDTGPMLAAFTGVIAYWATAGQAVAVVTARGGLKDSPIPVTALEAAPPALASALLVGMLYWLPAIPNNYTSIAWALAAVSLFAVSIPLAQKYYRYAGLALIFLVLARVFLVDTAQLEPAYRIAAGGVLGVVMCAIGYGYVRARQQGSQ